MKILFYKFLKLISISKSSRIKYRNKICIEKAIKRFLKNFDKNIRKYRLKTPGEIIGEDLKKTFGRYSYACEGFYSFSKETSVGSFCSIGQNVTLSTSHHPTNWLSTAPFCYYENMKLNGQTKFYDFEYSAPVQIGNDVWIGNNVTVMDGVKVGDGAIIGTNAVVTKDVPPYAIVAGVPAKIIKYRFDEETIKDLLELKWWELDEKYLVDLQFDDIQKCVSQLKEIRRNLL